MEKNKEMNFGFHTIYLKNFRRGLATNSSSTHSLIYRNDGELFKDLDIFELDYYGRCDSTIAASRDAKIKYVLAAIMWNEPLVKVMSSIYPEMKQYFPKIKDAFADDYDNEKFGMYCRGSLDFEGNLEASVDYLRNVIDNKEIVIVGGSDEMDFVYDTISGHVEVPDPDMVRYGDRSGKRGVTKNGNYWVGYGDTHDFVHKITNQCDNGCPFCFMDSDMQGKHADIKFLLYNVVNAMGEPEVTKRNRCEFSIGGGSVILYPELETLLKVIHQKGHIANVTINIKDCEKIMNDHNLARIFKNYVDGIGVSVFSVDDVKTLSKFYQFFRKNMCTYQDGYKYIVAHLIPELIGVKVTKDIQKAVYDDKDLWCHFLYLGYKTNGRGSNVEVKEFTRDELDDLFDKAYAHIDTTFANRYWWYIKDNFSTGQTITLNEGEFSMYVDGVEEKAYKSSYQLDKPYNMDYDQLDENGEHKKWYGLIEAFTEIRRDGGFKVYNEVKHHYYDDAKHYWEEN